MDLWLRRVRQGSFTRARIVDAAVELARVEGLSSLTTVKVARRSRASPGGIQRHFPKVDDLRLAVIDRWLEQVRHNVLAPAKRSSHGLGRIWAMTETWLVWSTVLHFPIQEVSIDRALSPQVRLPVIHLMHQWLGFTWAALVRAELLGETVKVPSKPGLVFQLHSILWASSWATTAMGSRDFVQHTAQLVWNSLSAVATHPDQTLPRLEQRLPRLRREIERHAQAPIQTEAADDSRDETGGHRPYWDYMAPDDPARLRVERESELLGSRLPNSIFDLHLSIDPEEFPPRQPPDPLRQSDETRNVPEDRVGDRVSEDSGSEDSGAEDSGSEDSGAEGSGSEDSGWEDSGPEASGPKDSGRSEFGSGTEAAADSSAPGRGPT